MHIYGEKPSLSRVAFDGLRLSLALASGDPEIGAPFVEELATFFGPREIGETHQQLARVIASALRIAEGASSELELAGRIVDAILGVVEPAFRKREMLPCLGLDKADGLARSNELAGDGIVRREGDLGQQKR